jgi:hypothetical protein
VVDSDRVSEAGDVNHGAAVVILGERFRIQSCTHQDNFQVWSLRGKKIKKCLGEISLSFLTLGKRSLTMVRMKSLRMSCSWISSMTM